MSGILRNRVRLENMLVRTPTKSQLVELVRLAENLKIPVSSISTSHAWARYRRNCVVQFLVSSDIVFLFYSNGETFYDESKDAAGKQWRTYEQAVHILKANAKPE